jgi:hypothetical protein
MIGIERHIRVCQEYLQPRPSLAGILERLRKGPSRRETLPLKLPRDPFEERLDVWLAVSQPMQALVLAWDCRIPLISTALNEASCVSVGTGDGDAFCIP